MLPEHIESAKGFFSTETIEEKIETQVLNHDDRVINNAGMDNFDEAFSNQRNSQEIESIKGSWTYQEEMQLYKLHDELGNKWSMIAEYFENRYLDILFRNDNSVKNHFYSRLRKALRRLNKIICVEMKKSMKEIKNNVIYKIIEVTEERHKISSQDAKSVEITEICRELKSRLLNFSYDQIETNQEQIDFYSVGKQLIKDLVAFNRQYRRKGKKTSNEVSEVKTVHKNKKTKSEETFNVLSISECSLFESESSASENNKTEKHQVLTRRRAKSGEYEQLKPSDLGVPAPITPSTQNLMREHYEAFFKESSTLENNLFYQPETIKKEENELHIGKIMEELPEFEFFDENDEEHNEKVDSQDHFSDPCLNEGNFSLFK